MEFTQMFKTESPRKTLFGDRRDSAESFGSGKTLADFYRKNDSNSNRNRIDKENISCNEAQDSNLNNKTDSNSYEHLYASLQQMGVYSGAKDFSPAALTVVQTLLKERDHWMSHASNALSEVSSLRGQLSTTAKELDREQIARDNLLKDQQLMQNRMAALATEHREVRNHWLSEKSDLEGRFHQMQALHTQLQGTLKKREKDYDKLQGQLAKLVRDSVRGNKACMTISLPLKKNLSQDSSSIKTTAALLKDAEVIANKAALSSMLEENTVLREAMEDLRLSLSELRGQFDTALAVAEAQSKAQLDSILAESQISSTSSSVMTAACQTEVFSPAPPKSLEPTSTPSRSCMKTITTNVPITPGRSVQWVVEQVNTEVKKLREKAETISSFRGASRAVTFRNSNCAADSKNEVPLQSSDIEHQKYLLLKSQLSEALAVIQEQDRLIHDALLGKLSSMADIDEEMESLSNSCSPSFPVEDREVAKIMSDATNSLEVQLGPQEDSIPYMVEASEPTPHSKPWRDSDFLPPASPETIALLAGFGWASLPRRRESLGTGKADKDARGRGRSSFEHGLKHTAGVDDDVLLQEQLEF